MAPKKKDRRRKDCAETTIDPGNKSQALSRETAPERLALKTFSWDRPRHTRNAADIEGMMP